MGDPPVDPHVMTHNTATTTDRHTTTAHHAGVPTPDRTPQRTTGGLVAVVAMALGVVGAAFAPIVTAAVLATLTMLAVTVTSDRTTSQTTGSTYDPGDTPATAVGGSAD